MRATVGCVVLLGALAACSSGSGGSRISPGLVPQVPQGSGQLTIPMAGDWLVTDVQIVETSDPSAVPVNGGVVTLSDTSVMQVDGDPASREALETELGRPLTTYVNQVDGRTVLYGYRVEADGLWLELGAAGGAVDANTIAVEARTSMLLVLGSEPLTIRTRYTLVRQIVPMAIERDGGESRPRGVEPFFGWPAGTLEALSVR